MLPRLPLPKHGAEIEVMVVFALKQMVILVAAHVVRVAAVQAMGSVARGHHADYDMGYVVESSGLGVGYRGGVVGRRYCGGVG